MCQFYRTSMGQFYLGVASHLRGAVVIRKQTIPMKFQTPACTRQFIIFKIVIVTAL